jgi:o-succinylbenzoate synthase
VRISSAEVLERRWPLAAVLHTARGTVRERRGLVLRLASERGAVGLGEASPAGWVGGESLGAARASLDEIARQVVRGMTACALASALTSLPLAASAAFALDCALLDLDARERNRSVAEVLATLRGGGVPASRVGAAALLTSTEAAAAATEAAAAAVRGFCCFKLKVGAGAVDEDLERISAVAGVLPRSGCLRLDANRAWSLAEAKRVFARLPAAAVVDFVEEPLAEAKPASLDELRRECGLRIALDESIDTAERLDRMVEAGALDVLVLKAARLGGLRAALWLAERARALGIDAVVTDSLEGPIGMSAAVELAAALPEPRRPIGLAGARLLHESAVPDLLRAAEIRVPRPGLGVSLADGEGMDRADA